MMIFLLEDCNFACGHCVREDEPMYPGYKLSFEQLKLCLLDCRKLETIEWVHFSGGEPTLWTDEKLDLADLLIEISKAGFEPGFTTNGSYFDDYEKCDELFQKYFNFANKRLRLYLSIDTFHQNFDAKIGRAESLDNVIKYTKNISPEKRKLLNIIVLTTISKEAKSLLPNNMIEYYEAFLDYFMGLSLSAQILTGFLIIIGLVAIGYIIYGSLWITYQSIKFSIVLSVICIYLVFASINIAISLITDVENVGILWSKTSHGIQKIISDTYNFDKNTPAEPKVSAVIKPRKPSPPVIIINKSNPIDNSSLINEKGQAEIHLPQSLLFSTQNSKHFSTFT